MKPAPVDIEFVRGDTYSQFGRVRTRAWDAVSQSYVAGPYKNLTGWTGLAQVRESVDSNEVLFSFTIELGDQDIVPGAFFIKSTPALTKDLTVLKGVWDLQWTTNTGEVFTYAGGEVTLKKDVSRV